jgi:SAM-dependent methyltransferase
MPSSLVSASQRFRALVRRHGLGHALTAARDALVLRLERRADREWDREHGIDTCGVTHLGHLEVEGENLAQGVEYDPTPVRLLAETLRRLPGAEGFTFVDYGSGKGRVLFVAAEFPFRRLIGVEFARELHDAAVRNLASYRNPRQRCREIRPVLGDALRFAIPDEPCVLYFCTPFKAPLVRKVLDLVAASYAQNPRPMYVVYAFESPYHLALYGAINGFTRVPLRQTLSSRLFPGRVKVLVYGTRETAGAPRRGRTRARPTVLSVLGAACLAGCAGTAPIPPTYTEQELRAQCQRQTGYWKADPLRGDGFCEFRGP